MFLKNLSKWERQENYSSHAEIEWVTKSATVKGIQSFKNSWLDIYL